MTSALATVRGLACRECGHAYPEGPAHVCERCFGPLEVQYDREAIARQVSRASIAAGPPSMWRYAPLLPVAGPPPAGRHAGFTPLVRARHLAEVLGVRELYVKNDGACHPTWSFKDRVVAVATAKAREFGFDTLACASTGNLAGSVAAHAAEAGLAAFVFVPADLEAARLLGTRVYGPTVVTVDGTYDEVNRLCSEVADRRGWAFVNINLRPFYAEGSKTCGYEIAEQLGWRAPAHVVVPCAGGSLLTKIWQSFHELSALGLIGPVTTRVHAAQPAGCDPIVGMVRRDSPDLVPVRPRTIARSLAIGNPADGYHAYRAVRASGGHAETAADDEALEAVELLARTEGIFAETAGGVTLAAAAKLVEQGRIPRDEPIVLCVTGGGLKTVETLAGRPDGGVRIPPTLAAFDRALADLKRPTGVPAAGPAGGPPEGR
jgi:threonine synthase